MRVAKLQEPAVAILPPSSESQLFAPDDPVLPGGPESMAFGDHRWDLSILGLAANQVAGSAVLNFDRFLKPIVLEGLEEVSAEIRLSPIWLVRAKEVIAILVGPTRHTSHGQLDVYRVRESSSSTLKTVLAHVYALAVWGTREALPPDLDRWQQDDLDDFIAYVTTERTNQRSGGQGLDSISVRGYVHTLRTLHLLRDTLTDGGFSFNPWEGMTAEQVTGADVSVCRTKPIPAEQYQPLMRNLWKVNRRDRPGPPHGSPRRRRTEQQLNSAVVGKRESAREKRRNLRCGTPDVPRQRRSDPAN